MSDLLLDLAVPARVVAAIEANTVAYWASHSAVPGAEMHREAGRLWIRSNRPCPITNCVLWAAFPPDEADRRIEETLDLYRTAGLPVIWSVGPSSRPADLAERLRAHGLRPMEEEPGMAVALHRLPEEWPVPAGLTIEAVEGKQALRRWVGAYIAGFDLPAHWREDLLAWESDPGDEERGLRRLYVGLLRGRPVATAQLVLGGGVAGLYGLSTLPRARRLGIGTAMTLFVMRRAFALGYRVGVLYAAAMGMPIYRRLGFRPYMLGRDYIWEEE